VNSDDGRPAGPGEAGAVKDHPARRRHPVSRLVSRPGDRIDDVPKISVAAVHLCD